MKHFQSVVVFFFLALVAWGQDAETIRKAEAGDIKAQGELAYYYYYEKANHAEALKWAKFAAEAGDNEAQMVLSALYGLGEGGLQENKELSLKWAHKSAVQGNNYHPSSSRNTASSSSSTSSSSYSSTASSSGSSVSSVSSKSRKLYSGTYTISSNGYAEATGNYIGAAGPDLTCDVEIYEDYVKVCGSDYKYSKNTRDGKERVYEGTNFLGQTEYYYVNPKTFAMRKRVFSPNPFGGGDCFFSYAMAKGETTFNHNSMGNRGGGYSGGSSGTRSRSTGSSGSTAKKRKTCPLCHGKKRIVRESGVATYGNNSKVRCSECGGYFWRSTGHSHITCTQCHGKGYFEY